MKKKLLRELYLLPRGEQRGLILLSLLLFLSLVFRFTVSILPDRKPEGLEEFEQEARLLMAALAEADSLRQIQQDSSGNKGTRYPGRSYPSNTQKSRILTIQPIDINRADSTDLLPLPGIGPVYAGRIIRYRNLLGGFLSVDQLGEVYGIPAETIQKIRSMVTIDSTSIRRIQIVSASFRDLLRHPYLEYADVKALVNYRDFKGDIESFRELQENNILEDSVLIKVAPYFSYSNSEAVDVSK